MTDVTILRVIKAGYFDLHMHTTASDGAYSPRDLVRKAHAAGLRTIAITDHDTLEGIDEACRTGLKYGIHVIPGIEISTKYQGHSVDILGYHVTANPELTEILSLMREGREQRALRIIRKFAELGMPITMGDVKQFSKGNVIARPHIAMAVVQKGYVPDYQTAFDEYLADGKPCAIDKVILSPEEGIGLIHRSGGKAVLAHPVLLGDDELVRDLMRFPFDGIEVWHRKQDNIDSARYQRIAEQFHLMMTGGSDFHNDEHSLGQFGLNWEGGDPCGTKA
jgi:predicted metal-dependent phosphoesterase TrpH